MAKWEGDGEQKGSSNNNKEDVQFKETENNNEVKVKAAIKEDEIKEEADKFAENYIKTLEELKREKPISWLKRRLRGRYALSEEVENNILRYLVAAIIPSDMSPEFKPHLVIKGPPGTGKSYLVGEVTRLASVKQINISPADTDFASVITQIFLLSRIFRRYSMMSLMELEGKAIVDVYKDVADKLGIKEAILYKVIGDNIFNILDLVQPLEPSKGALITNLKMEIEKKEGKDLNENFIISAFNTAMPGVPVVIFIDEIDAIGSRDLMANKSLNELLLQINSSSLVSFNNGITVIGITNKAYLLDEALTRPGRLKVVTMPYPSRQTRKLIAETLYSRYKSVTVDFENPSKAIELISSIPFSTGAHIQGLYDNVVVKKAETYYGESLKIKDDEIYENLANTNSDKLDMGPFIEVEGRTSLLEALKGKIRDEPVWLRASRVFFDALKEVIDDLLNVIILRLQAEKGNESSTVEESAVAVFYNVLTRALPTTVALSHVIKYLEHSLKDKQGRVIGFNDPEISSEMCILLSYISLKHVLEENKDEDHRVIVNVDAAKVLSGIISITPKNIEQIKEKLEEAKDLIVHIKNCSVLFGTGNFNAEHVPKFDEMIRSARANGHIIIYDGPVLIDNTDYRLDLFTSRGTNHIKGEIEIIELLRERNFSEQNLKELYIEILKKLTELVKTENLKDPSRFGHEYVRTSSVLQGTFELDRYLEGHKEVKTLIMKVTEFAAINSPIRDELEQKAKELTLRLRAAKRRALEQGQGAQGVIVVKQGHEKEKDIN
jgi:Cdc6-like AAA superfamily ATPase